jgi:hypothetical protein
MFAPCLGCGEGGVRGVVLPPPLHAHQRLVHTNNSAQQATATCHAHPLNPPRSKVHGDICRWADQLDDLVHENASHVYLQYRYSIITINTHPSITVLDHPHGKHEPRSEGKVDEKLAYASPPPWRPGPS